MSANNKRNTHQNPWRSGPAQDGPPDLTHLFKKIFGTNPSMHLPSHFNAGKIAALVILAIVVLWFFSGLFLVSPAEQSVILRFGKYVRTVGPGPHWIPALIESHNTANIQRVDSFPYEAEMLTQDGNIVAVKIQVQYRINDLKNYLFNVVGPVTTLHQAASSALRQVIGRMNLDPILTTGREELAQRVSDLLQQTLLSYHSGIEVREVTLQSSKPPEAVTMAFDDVIKATEDEKRYINQAEAYAKKRVLIAQGEASRITQEAGAYRYAVVAQANGATIRYLALLRPYQQAPAVTRERLYLDTMTQVLKNTNNILVEDHGNNVLYLPLEQLLNRQQSSTVSTVIKQPAATETINAPSPAGNESPVIGPETSGAASSERPSYPLPKEGASR